MKGYQVEMTTDAKITVLGYSGSGKSTLVKKLILMFPRYIVWDYMHEYAGLGYLVSDIKMLKHVANEGYPYIIYQPHLSGYYSKQEALFEEVNKIVLYGLPNYMYVIEEADKFIRSKFVPPLCNELVQRGRHSGIGMMFIARRMFRLNPDAPENSKHIFLFNVHLPRDLDYIRNIHPDLEEAKTLEEFEYIHYVRGDKVYRCKPIEIRKNEKEMKK